MSPLFAATNKPQIDVSLHKIDKRHDVIERRHVAKRHANYISSTLTTPTSAHGMSVHHIVGVGAGILLQRQSTRKKKPSHPHLQHLLRLIQVLPTRSGIAVAARADVDVLRSGRQLDLPITLLAHSYVVVAEVRPVGVLQVDRQNAALHVLVVKHVLSVDLHQLFAVATSSRFLIRYLWCRPSSCS